MANVAGLLPKGISVFANGVNRRWGLGDKPRLNVLNRPSEPFKSAVIRFTGREKQPINFRHFGLNEWLGSGRPEDLHRTLSYPFCSPFTDSKEILQEIYCYSQWADVVVISRPYPESTFSLELYRRAVDSARPETVFIHPVNSAAVASLFNYVLFYGTADAQTKLQALLACRSQVSRVHFDEVQRNMALSVAAEEGPKAPFQYAERFPLALLRPDGSAVPFGPHIRYNLPAVIKNVFGDKKHPTAVSFSPHADDLQIPSGALALLLKRLEWRVFDLVLTSGHMGVLDSFAGDRLLPQEKGNLMAAKLRIRAAELAASDNLLGVDAARLLNLGFYDRRKPDGPDKGRRLVLDEDIAAVREAVNAWTGEVELALVPLEWDMNWDHKATLEIAMNVLKPIAKRQGHPVLLAGAPSPWFTGIPAVNALLFRYADEGFRAEHPADYYAQMALAEAGRELVSGLDPLAFGHLADCPSAKGHVMAEGYYIAAAKDLKNKLAGQGGN